MRLTKLQRYTAYCIMMAEIEGDQNHVENAKHGLCYLVMEVFGDFNGKYLTPFDEIIKRKPRNLADGPYWFERSTSFGWSKRIAVLKKAISETEPKYPL